MSDTAGWDIRPCRNWVVIVAALAVVAMAAVLLSGLPFLLRLLVATVLLTYALVQLRRLAFPPWVRIAIDEGQLVLSDNHRRVTRLVPGRRVFVSPLYVGLSGRDSGSGRRVRTGLFRDQVEHDAFRRLSVFLRGATPP